MKTRTLFLSILLLAATWVVAQSTAPPDSTPQAGASNGQQTPSSQQTPDTQQTPSQPSSTPNTNDQSNPAGTQNASPSGTQNNPATQSGSTTTQGYGNQAGSSANQTTIRGCLGGSPSSGTYYLTDSQTGGTYMLMGNADQLRTHIGQQVEITGRASSNTGSSTAGSNAIDQQAGAKNSFQ